MRTDHAATLLHSTTAHAAPGATVRIVIQVVVITNHYLP